MNLLNNRNTFRVVAYNFLSGGNLKRGRHWSRLATALTPEVVLAQECRAPQESPGELFRPGPSHTLLWQPAPGRRWGSALFSTLGPVRPISIPGFDGWVVGGEMNGT